MASKRRLFWKFFRWLGLSVAGICVLLGMSFALLNYLLPLEVPKIDVSTTVVAKDGEVLRQFSNEDGVFRHWISLEEVSPDYLHALIQYEDRYYYQHFGVNPFSSLRALWQMIIHQKIISGSSTLTMQVSRLLYPHERTFFGKLQQVFRAVQLELNYSKAEILTLYINLAPMGGNIEGVSAASERYFSKSANELTLSESALLVALPQRPSVYRPDRNLTLARNARDKVLRRLYDFGKIDEQTWQLASQDPINYQPSKTPFHAPLFADRVRRQFPDQHRIESTINYDLQRHLETFLLAESQKFPKHLSSAILVVNNHTHEVEAYLGSVDLFDANRAGFVDMVTAIRSPGSTLKPFAYGLGLDYGVIHEASLLTDVPRAFDGYEPQNFDKEFRGRVPMFRALQQSLNVPVVQVFQHLTPFYFLQKMREAGIDLHISEPTLSMILGGVGITLEEQVRLFSSFGPDGKVYPLIMVKDSQDAQSSKDSQEQIEPTEPMETAEPAGKPILSPASNWIITKTLRNITPSKRINSRRIAWKTGTSYGYRDGWALGVSADWTVGVWVGRPDSVPNVGILAGDIAVPLLFDTFAFLPKDQSTFKKPYNVQEAIICWPSGRKKAQLPEDECLEEFKIDTIAGNVPRTLYDAKGESPHNGWPILLADDFIADILEKNMTRQAFFQKYHSESQNDRAGKPREIPIYGVKILTLANESIIFKSDYKIHLSAQGKSPFRWYLNGELLQTPALDIQTLNAGQYRLSVQDEQGNSDQIQFEIREIE